jgi:hypothetical protein
MVQCAACGLADDDCSAATRGRPAATTQFHRIDTVHPTDTVLLAP